MVCQSVISRPHWWGFLGPLGLSSYQKEMKNFTLSVIIPKQMKWFQVFRVPFCTHIRFLSCVLLTLLYFLFLEFINLIKFGEKCDIKGSSWSSFPFVCLPLTRCSPNSLNICLKLYRTEETPVINFFFTFLISFVGHFCIYSSTTCEALRVILCSPWKYQRHHFYRWSVTWVNGFVSIH